MACVSQLIFPDRALRRLRARRVCLRKPHELPYWGAAGRCVQVCPRECRQGPAACRGIGREALPAHVIRCGGRRRRRRGDHPAGGSVRGSPRIEPAWGATGPAAGRRLGADAGCPDGRLGTDAPACEAGASVLLGEVATWPPAWGVPNPASPSCGLPVNYIAGRGRARRDFGPAGRGGRWCESASWPAATRPG